MEAVSTITDLPDSEGAPSSPYSVCAGSVICAVTLSVVVEPLAESAASLGVFPWHRAPCQQDSALRKVLPATFCERAGKHGMLSGKVESSDSKVAVSDGATLNMFFSEALLPRESAATTTRSSTKDPCQREPKKRAITNQMHATTR